MTSGLAIAFQAIHYITIPFTVQWTIMEYPKKLSFDRWTASLEILEKVENLDYFSTTSTGFNNYASLICGKGSASFSAAKAARNDFLCDEVVSSWSSDVSDELVRSTSGCCDWCLVGEIAGE